MIGTHADTMGGISSVVGVYRDAGLFQRFPIEYIATHRDGGAGRKLRTMGGALWRFAVLALRGQVALAHVHTASRASFWRKSLFFLIAFLCRIPVLLHLHGAEFHVFYERDCGPLRRWLVRAIYNRVSHVVVLSASWRDWVSSISRNPRISVVYNPVVVPPAVADWSQRLPGQTLFFGRVGQRKGTYDLLAAAASLKAEFPGLRLDIGGDGEVEHASAEAAALGLQQQVHFLGWVRGDAKAAALARSSIYALPSYNEGLPMSVLEAMAAGLPILSTPVGGIPEAVSDGVEGFLVPAGDVAQLTARWRQLLADPALAQRMGAAARHKVQTTFSAQALLPQIESIYLALGAARA
ncbi:glycosyltransferase family 4 protein [Massilia sp. NR 4-1]|uniref:glycosyltransferase family 4 protein n=1 Tax=Massilia sp. NR 4-1 TaxID=1678028 RepID=UPI0016813694|nr:glycosyltransferase family 4 protein [Massilia sp. NR 4-1]